MSRPNTMGSAISAIALASMLAGCAAPFGKGVSASRLDNPKAQFATRAMIALNANDLVNAVALAEQAAEARPNDPAVRALLGTVYFATGRFASAETSYKDALALNTGDPKVVLKLALVQVALGKNEEALGLLNAARGVLETADYGLALALAGRPADAVTVLAGAARIRGADARVRQNLALSYALNGDWTAARTVAAQDLPADQIDARMDQWLKLSNPARPSDQVAALTGISPIASDPGQPVRLALKDSKTALAAAQPVPVPSPALAPVEMAEAAPLPVYAPPASAAEPVPPFKLEPVDVAQEPFVDIAPPLPAPRAAPVPRKAAPSVRAASFVPKRTVARPRATTGTSAAVVQIGAYGSPARVAEAWSVAAGRYAALRRYMPVSARFQSAAGPVYRLSVKGFATPAEAKELCVTLRRSGGNCFVRNVAGDAPVRIASR